MEVLQEESNKEGRFYVLDNDEEIATLEYVLHGGNTMEITHTEVDEKYKGKNIGGILVERAVEVARTNQQRVKPSCSFAHAYIQRHPALQDVLS